MKLQEFGSKFVAMAGNRRILVILLITCLFIIVSVFMMKRIVKPKSKDKFTANSEFVPNTATSNADIYIFHTLWCPHCKTAMPIWLDFKKEMEGKTVNGIELIFHEIDCDKDTKVADKFGVKGFPTIKLQYGSQIIEYDAKPSKANLSEFVNRVIGKKTSD